TKTFGADSESKVAPPGFPRACAYGVLSTTWRQVGCTRLRTEKNNRCLFRELVSGRARKIEVSDWPPTPLRRSPVLLSALSSARSGKVWPVSVVSTWRPFQQGTT